MVAIYVLCLFVVVQGFGIASAMNGNVSWLMAFFPTIAIASLLALPWCFILPIRALRWAWRSIGAADYFAGR